MKAVVEKTILSVSELNSQCKKTLENNFPLIWVEEDKSRNAYYIVKGGGIPRIDIMGYENNVDWNTLIERLQSIQQSNQEAIIE